MKLKNQSNSRQNTSEPKKHIKVNQEPHLQTDNRYNPEKGKPI